MLLVSIFITSLEQETKELPLKVKENIESFKQCHPGIEHRLFTGSMIKDFIFQHFGADTLEAYEDLKPYSYKADLARYCIIYHFGGVYADISTYFLRRWPPPIQGSLASERRIAVFVGPPIFAPWSIPQTVFSAPEKHKALAKAIDLLRSNVKRRYYGSTPLCPTGPVLFGRSIASTCEPEEVIWGETKLLNPSGELATVISEPSLSFVFKNNLVAIKRKRGGGPQTELGITGGNQYTDAWYRRDIYK